MFTGLIEAVGRVAASVGDDAARRLSIAAALGRELSPGDSVAVDGVCLTAVEVDDGAFTALVSPATLRVTTLGHLERGRPVNLERALRADARIGGHFVLGHVDGLGRIDAWRDDGDASWLEVEVPEPLLPAIVPRGSVAINGISLTVASLEGRRIGIQIVPFTRQHTGLRDARPGDAVNIETDVIGKHVARWLEERAAGAAVHGGR